MEKKKVNDIEIYIADYPENVRMIMEKLRQVIKEIVPEARETIGYGIPTFKLKGRNLVHFGGFENHIGFFPGSEAIEVFQKELLPYKTSKGTVQFPLDKPIPYPLVKKIVKYRVKIETKRNSSAS